MGKFVRVAAVNEIPEGKIRAYEIEHVSFVLAHSAEGIYALANECTHDSEPIANGRIRGGDIMCIRHGARFDLKTGAVTAPPAIVPLDTYEVKVEGDEIFVYLE
jgi:3-phenylpropionate/trans-cinnamate dioxygenase ferredoxin component